MDDVIEQVKAAGELADKLWQEHYGKKEEVKVPHSVAPGPEAKPEENYIPIMTLQLGEQGRKIDDLEERLTELSRSKQEPKPEEKPIGENESGRHFRENYPDIADGVSVIAKSMIDEAKAEIDQKITKVDQDVGRSRKEKFLQSLDSDPDIGKDWRTLNNDSAFIDSLQAVEPYTGLTKHQLLLDAWNKQDLERVRQFFRQGKKTVKVSKPDIERRHDTPTVTREDLKQFYEDVRMGKWNGKEKEMRAEERRLIEGLGVKLK